MLAKKDRWLLPEGVGELLPEQAEPLEQLRRGALNLFHSWGYEMVMPPMVEYLESLLVGTGSDLDLQTFKLIDQQTGRLMGIRADMTPQVARIDAHQLMRDIPTRLCYSGPVLHTLPSGFGRSRVPQQIGAELYGHDGAVSDIEVFRLMVETLNTCGVRDLHIDLGHVGIYRGLVKEAGLDEEQEETLFDVLQRKARPELDAYLMQWKVCEKHQRHLKALIELNGDSTVLDEARERLADVGLETKAALDNLCEIAELASQYVSNIPFYFDLAELRGYRYQTGLVFAAFVPGYGQEIARGGRYDNIGKAFGRARPATGFSADLKMLARFSEYDFELEPPVYAPFLADLALSQAIDELRNEGIRVVQALSDDVGEAKAMGCSQVLKKIDDQWQLIAVDA